MTERSRMRWSFKKALQAEQAKVRLNNHLHELGMIKEQLAEAHAAQMRNIGGGGGALVSIVGLSGDEESSDQRLH